MFTQSSYLEGFDVDIAARVCCGGILLCIVAAARIVLLIRRTRAVRHLRGAQGDSKAL